MSMNGLAQRGEPVRAMTSGIPPEAIRSPTVRQRSRLGKSDDRVMMKPHDSYRMGHGGQDGGPTCSGSS